MTLLDYFWVNGVKLYCYNTETFSLRYATRAENLDKIIGERVWICDYRAGTDVFNRPIRAIKPMLVEVRDATQARKKIYRSPVYFLSVKRDGTVGKQEICPVDNTEALTSVDIFPNTTEGEMECKRSYLAKIDEALSEVASAQEYYEKKVADKRKALEELKKGIAKQK